LGAALALGLAAAVGDVILGGREFAALARTARELASSVPAERVHTWRADLSRLDDVRDLAASIGAEVEQIDVLANVAGALVHERQVTDDGIELTFQVHVVAPFLLTSLLLPQLAAASDPRVLTMASGGMYTKRLDVDVLVGAAADTATDEPFDGTATYAMAKRAQVVLNEEWARRRPGLGIGFHALHPGWVDTPGLQTSLPGFASRLRRVLRTPEQGADTALWLSWTPDATAAGGDFWHDRRRRHTHAVPWTRAPHSEADRLWHRTTILAGLSDAEAVR
jgi:NAD(P)-dependent dehydrogenase (short-subunit alcohol dehydrogenase family)